MSKTITIPTNDALEIISDITSDLRTRMELEKGEEKAFHLGMFNTLMSVGYAITAEDDDDPIELSADYETVLDAYEMFITRFVEDEEEEAPIKKSKSQGIKHKPKKAKTIYELMKKLKEKPND